MSIIARVRVVKPDKKSVDEEHCICSVKIPATIKRKYYIFTRIETTGNGLLGFHNYKHHFEILKELVDKLKALVGSDNVVWISPTNGKVVGDNRPPRSGAGITGQRQPTRDDFLHAYNNRRCRGKLDITIFDHFGLDIEDIKKFGTKESITEQTDFVKKIKDCLLVDDNLVPRDNWAFLAPPEDYTIHIHTLAAAMLNSFLETAAKGFRAWFILQHYYGYRPFVNIMERKIAFEGSMDCEKPDSEQIVYQNDDQFHRIAYPIRRQKKNMWWMD